jgi:DNA-nicking Smr family endonuclease
VPEEKRSKLAEDKIVSAEDMPDEPVAIPISGELDLHTFQPRELRDVLTAYFAACLEREIFTVRVIHGKGTGALRDSVHRELRRMSEVEKFWNADAGNGGWGATWVGLRRKTC